jgi:hypothetical protein
MPAAGKHGAGQQSATKSSFLGLVQHQTFQFRSDRRRLFLADQKSVPALCIRAPRI